MGKTSVGKVRYCELDGDTWADIQLPNKPSITAYPDKKKTLQQEVNGTITWAGWIAGPWEQVAFLPGSFTEWEVLLTPKK